MLNKKRLVIVKKPKAEDAPIDARAEEEPFYGESRCMGRDGECTNKAYYALNGKYLCGVHATFGFTCVELRKNPDAKAMKEATVADRHNSVERAALSEPESRTQSPPRHSSVEPKFLGPVNHVMRLKPEVSKMTCSICKQEERNKRSCKKIPTSVSAQKIEAETVVKAPAPVKVEMPTHPPMDKSDRVKRLREHLTLSKVNHEDQIMKQATLKAAHTYCVMHGLSAQKYGPLLERFIRIKFNYIKNKAEDCTGDCSKDGKNSEVKVSLGGETHTKFNFVQIRPSHDCDTYILTAYNLSSDNVESEGELYIFKVPKEEIKKIVVSFGGYAHGTIKEHGKITIESLNDKKSTKEYALRPTINDACWKALMAFRIPESDL